MREQERHPAWAVLTVCAVMIASVTLGSVVAATEKSCPAAAMLIKVIFWSAFACAVIYAAWVDGRRFEREHGDRTCGAPSEDESEDEENRTLNAERSTLNAERGEVSHADRW